MERSCVLNAETVSAFTVDWGNVFHCGTVATKRQTDTQSITTQPDSVIAILQPFVNFVYAQKMRGKLNVLLKWLHVFMPCNTMPATEML